MTTTATAAEHIATLDLDAADQALLATLLDPSGTQEPWEHLLDGLEAFSGYDGGDADYEIRTVGDALTSARERDGLADAPFITADADADGVVQGWSAQIFLRHEEVYLAAYLGENSLGIAREAVGVAAALEYARIISREYSRVEALSARLSPAA